MFFKKQKDAISVEVSQNVADITPLKHAYSLKSRIIKTAASLLTGVIALSGIGLASLAASPAAYAGAMEDWTCDGYEQRYQGLGWGTFGAIHEANIFGGLADIQSTILDVDEFSNTKLTAYEQYGTSGAYWTVWRSVDKEDIEKKFDRDKMFDKIVGPDKTLLSNSTAKAKLEEGYPNSLSSPYWAKDWTECVDGNFINGTAGFIFTLSKLGVFAVNTVYGMAMSTNSESFWLAPFYDAVDRIVLGDSAQENTTEDVLGGTSTNNTWGGTGNSGLINQLYLPFILVFLTIAALYLAWRGLVKGRTLEFFQGGIWMIVAVIGGWILIAAPTALPKTIDNVLLQGINIVNSAINGVVSGGNDTTATLCKAGVTSPANPDGSITIGGNLNNGDFEGGLTGAMSQAVRESQCNIWYSVVYLPWAIGQYGVNPATDSAFLTGDPLNAFTDSRRLVEVKFGNYTVPSSQLSWPLVQLDMQSEAGSMARRYGSPASDEMSALSSVIALTQLGGKSLTDKDGNSIPFNSAGINNSWKGNDAGGRLVMAISSLLGLIAVAILVLLFGFRMIIYQVSILFLVVVAPFVAMIAVHPGTGKRVALKWVEMMASLTVKRFLAATLLSVFLMFFSIAISLGTDLFIIQWIMIGVITAIGLGFSSKIINSADRINFGGYSPTLDGMSTKSMGNKLGNLVGQGAGLAMAAATGGAAAVGTMAAGQAAKGMANKGASSTPVGPALPAGQTTQPGSEVDVSTPQSQSSSTVNVPVDDSQVGETTGYAGPIKEQGKLGRLAKGTAGVMKKGLVDIPAGVVKAGLVKGIASDGELSAMKSGIVAGYNKRRTAFEPQHRGTAASVPIASYSDPDYQPQGDNQESLDYEGQEIVSELESAFGSSYSNVREPEYPADWSNQIEYSDTSYRIGGADEAEMDTLVEQDIQLQQEMLSRMENNERPYTYGSAQDNEFWTKASDKEKNEIVKAKRAQLEYMKSNRKLSREVRFKNDALNGFKAPVPDMYNSESPNAWHPEVIEETRRKIYGDAALTAEPTQKPQEESPFAIPLPPKPEKSEPSEKPKSGDFGEDSDLPDWYK